MIIETFNLTYFLTLLVTAGVIVLLTFLAKNKSENYKRKMLLTICYSNAILWVVYKFWLAFGKFGIPDTYSFDIWTELPLHLCNISLIIVPIGIHLKKQGILAYGFFIAPLGAIMACTFPSVGFGDLNIFYPHMLGYYVTHLLIIVVGALLVSLGFFKPTFKKIPSMFITALALSLGAFLVNLFIRGVFNGPANYFYTIEPEGISILEVFWSIIPIPYVYLVFGMAILGVYAVITTLPFHLYDKKKNK